MPIVTAKISLRTKAKESLIIPLSSVVLHRHRVFVTLKLCVDLAHHYSNQTTPNPPFSDPDNCIQNNILWCVGSWLGLQFINNVY